MLGSCRKEPKAQVLWWLVFALVLGAFATLSSQAFAIPNKEIFVPPLETANTADSNWKMTNVSKAGNNNLEAHFQWIIPIDLCQMGYTAHVQRNF